MAKVKLAERKITCMAVVEHGRINLIIDKRDDGYEAFSKVLTAIKKKGVFCWYGDVEDEDGIERSGLVITSNT